jgi:hypothetical protein
VRPAVAVLREVNAANARLSYARAYVQHEAPVLEDATA